ncbi:hypothetical protein NP233_g1365 [Leucocoprinus birnbaumii]|uniref:Major facilitator superfamily (MFS) profile domain-containing protein n=1 Tax=Leucocoprinus birnbaumii TaxID=56174 RepID=A0AAD5YVW5_9AGAR|nr:hypothetical protein NP233_g1365 [Leucocoprinus birnbaumii]
MSRTSRDSPTTTVVASGQRPSYDSTGLKHTLSTTESKQNTQAIEEHPVAQHDGYRVVERSLFNSLVIVIVATLSMIVNIGNTTSVSISLPTIGQDFNADPTLLQWVVSSYPLSSVYLAGTFVLAAFTLGSGFATDILTLIILRAIQGIGAAATIPASLGILANAFPPSRARSLAFATFAAGAPIGGVFGNTIGGILTQRTAQTWRSGFWVFAAVNAICFVGGAFCIDRDIPDSSENRKIDWIGALIITAALVLILFVLGEGEKAPKGWSTGYIIALLIVGVFLVGVFIYWQWFLEKAQGRRVSDGESQSGSGGIDTGNLARTRDVEVSDRPSVRLPPPIMKISLWARAKGRFSAVMAIAFLTWASFNAWLIWIQLYYQDYAHVKPIIVVAYVVPMFVVGIMCNTFVGIMAARVPMIVITTFGTLCTASACILFALIDPKATYWAFGFPATITSVIGVDFVFTAGTLYIAKIALPHEQSLAGALFQTMVQLGTSAGITISTVVFDRVSLSLKEGEDNIKSYRAAHWTCCAFALCAALLSLVVFRGVGVPGHRKEDSEVTSRETDEQISRDVKTTEVVEGRGRA